MIDLGTLALGLILILAFALWKHSNKFKGQLESLGIPVEKTFLIFGSPPFVHHKTDYKDYYMSKFKEHGKTYGRYEGIAPVVCTIDPEIATSVTTKNADCFTENFQLELPAKHTTLDVSGGETWRAMRKALSPTFTSGKLKGMLGPMTGVADLMLDHVEKVTKKAEGGVIDIKDCFQGLAINTICKCTFGVEANAHENPEQDIVRWGNEAFSGFRISGWVEEIFIYLFFFFPGFEKVVNVIPKAFDHLHKMTSDIMQLRKEQGIKAEDFIARLQELKDTHKDNPDLKVLNDDIITAQGIVFFIAGYETTANTLSTLFYNLAKNPDVQEQVFEEVEEILARHDGRIDHETITEMKFLEATIQEDLRLTGPVLLHSRLCTKDCEIRPGMVIRKGTRVDMNIWASHHNPEYFPEPEVFRPERFLKENAGQLVNGTYRPFGSGLRVCIGQRFAMAEVKIAAAKMIANYKFSATPETKLEMFKGDLFLITFPEVKLKVEKRN